MTSAGDSRNGSDILVVHPFVGFVCGPDVLLYNVLRHLDRRAFRVHLVVPMRTPVVDKYAELVETLTVLPAARTVLRPKSPLAAVRMLAATLSAAWGLRRTIRKLGVDLVHTNAEAAWASALAARWSGVPSIVHAHGFAALWPVSVGRLTCRVLRMTADRVIVGTEQMSAAFQASGLPAGRLQVIENGIDTRSFGGAAGGETFRRKHGLDLERPLIGAVGSADPRKGWAYLLSAYLSLLPAHPTLQCALVGEMSPRGASPWGGSPYGDILKGLAASAPGSCIRFTGVETDMAAVYEALDVVVQPSITEGGALVPLEAAASGRPVVAFGVGGNLAHVRHETTGIVAPPGRVAPLAAAIDRLLADPGERVRMGEAGRRMVEQRHSIEAMVSRLEDAYRDLQTRGRS